MCGQLEEGGRTRLGMVPNLVLLFLGWVWYKSGFALVTLDGLLERDGNKREGMFYWKFSTAILSVTKGSVPYPKGEREKRYKRKGSVPTVFFSLPFPSHPIADTWVVIFCAGCY